MSSESEALINVKSPSIGEESEQKKDNSPAVVFSLWSTMMGSTVLVMPRLFRDAGLIPSIASTILMSLLCCYTAVLMTRVGKHYGASVTDVLQSLPSAAKISTLITSIFVFAGVCMIIHLYMAQSVMHFVGQPMTATQDRVIVSCSIGGAVFLISLLKKLGPLFAASSYCIIILVFCSIFILVKSALQLRDPSKCEPHLEDNYGLGWQGLGPVAALMSVMCVSFFCHNFVLQILTQATRPEKTERNVFFAFICTAATYVIPSATAVVAFAPCKDLSADFISMFDDVYSDIARGAVIILVGVVYPVVVFIARTQVLDAVFGTVEVEEAEPDAEKQHPRQSLNGEEQKEKVTTKIVQAPHPYWAHLLFNLLYLVSTSLPSVLNASLVVVSAAVGVFGTYWALVLPSALYIRMKLSQQEEETGSSAASTGEVDSNKKKKVSLTFKIGHILIIVVAIALMVTTIGTVVGIVPSAAPLPSLKNETTI